MKKVWLLDTGSDGMSIDGVFSTKENAELALRYLKKGYIHEYAIDPGIKALKRDYRLYSLTMLRDGTVERMDDAYPDLGESFVLWERTKAPAYKGTDVPDAMNATVFARNKKHAAKIANAKRVAMIKSGEWVGR